MAEDKKESRGLKLQRILKKYREKGRVTSTYRDSIDNERVYKELNRPVNETSYHQLQGGAFDIMDLPKKEGKEAVKKLLDEGFFAYRNKATGQIHGDVGPLKRVDRIKTFKKLKKEQDVDRGKFLYGAPQEKYLQEEEDLEDLEEIDKDLDVQEKKLLDKVSYKEPEKIKKKEEDIFTFIDRLRGMS